MKSELVVLVRIGLYIVAGKAMAGGWLPPELHPEIVAPHTIEAVTGALIALGAFLWYWFSQARAALKAAVKRVLR